MSRSKFEYAARWYAERGIFVFPLTPHSKKPLLVGGRGHLDATTDATVIEDWWRYCPAANIGIACSASSFVVLDVDTYRGGDESLGKFEREHGARPRTWECLSRGFHIYTMHTSAERFRGHLAGADCGVEIKHDGYVVAPPSVHPTGIVYKWDVGGHPTEIAVAPLPEAWARALRRPTTKGTRVATGPARESFFGAAFAAAGMLGGDLPSGAACASCPWFVLHTDERGDGSDSSTVILPPLGALRVGRFHCSHAHCAKRDLAELLSTLPKQAVAAAANKFPREMGAVMWRLTRLRREGAQ